MEEVSAERRAPRFGLSLPNRGVLFGATSVDELIEVSEAAEASGAFDSVWVGDSLFAKPRLESLVLLSAIAARTRRVRLGTCCLSTFPLRDPIFLAAQWAALDQVSHGRMILGACIGGRDRKSTRLNSSHVKISYAVFCLKKKKKKTLQTLEKKNKKQE